MVVRLVGWARSLVYLNQTVQIEPVELFYVTINLKIVSLVTLWCKNEPIFWNFDVTRSLI